jgi:hypothetical protein
LGIFTDAPSKDLSIRVELFSDSGGSPDSQYTKTLIYRASQ